MYFLTKSVIHILSSSLIHSLTHLFIDLHSHFLTSSQAISLTHLYAHLLTNISVTDLSTPSPIIYLLMATDSIVQSLTNSVAYSLLHSEWKFML